ncbi:helix-turn-helix domain-containing protein [Echinicola sediminis]
MLGFKSRVSEILNGKRKLSLSMIRKLSKSLEIPTEILVQEY